MIRLSVVRQSVSPGRVIGACRQAARQADKEADAGVAGGLAFPAAAGLNGYLPDHVKVFAPGCRAVQAEGLTTHGVVSLLCLLGRNRCARLSLSVNPYYVQPEISNPSKAPSFVLIAWPTGSGFS